MKETSIHPSRFGRDHWSTFAYIACVVTGRKGVPDNDRMRTDASRHPALVGPTLLVRGSEDVGQKYPTRLVAGETLADHDDWDCAEDLEAAGLIIWGGTGIYPVFDLTPAGWDVFKAFTAHQQSGGGTATFTYAFAEAVP